MPIRSLAAAHPSTDPPTWTLLYFDVADNDVEALAAQLSGALDGPGWYVDLQTADETFVVFPGPDLPLSARRWGRL